MSQPAVRVVALREQPAYLEAAIAYLQAKWATPESRMVYDDCIRHSVGTPSPLPHWYLLAEGDTLIGCAGLISNDFISRGDLWPWFCALYIDPAHRGHGYPGLLLARARQDAAKAGFKNLYLCTDHIGYYERYGFAHMGTGYHPWGESSRIYQLAI